MKYLYILFVGYIMAQEQTMSLHSPFNITDIDGVTPTPSGITSLNMTYQPSPTSFVFTHYPTHTSGVNASSSLLPSQSAPLPDDTIGKYGHLHISSAHFYPVPWIFIFSMILLING